jgi:pre-rRNA-processing protein TSR1
MSGRQRRITLFATPRDTNAVLDIAKVADIVVFVLGATAEGDDIDIDEFGTHALTVLKAQGMPAALGMQVGLAGLAPKKAQALRKLGARFFATALGDDCKVIGLDTVEEAQSFFRWVASDMKLKPLAWRDARPYLLAEQVQFTPNAAVAAVPAIGQFSFAPAAAPAAASTTGTLSVRGYLRGDNPLSADQLLHITGYGDFQIERIEGRIEQAQFYMSEKEKKASRAASKAASKAVSRRHSIDEDADMGASSSAAAAAAAAAASMAAFPASSMSGSGASTGDVLLQRRSLAGGDDLEGLVALNPLANEQSLIEDDELNHDDDGEEQGEEEYDEDGEEQMEADQDEEMGGAGEASKPRGAVARWSKKNGARDTSGAIIPHTSRRRPLNQAPEGASSLSSIAKAQASKPGALVRSQVAWDDAVPDDDEEPTAEDAADDAALGYMDDQDGMGGAAAVAEKQKLERDEQTHPDEVEYPMHTECRTRFARYRGLKSFKDSAWDSRENLPLEYGQIFQFQNFEASKNRVIKDAQSEDNGGLRGDANSVATQRFYPVTIVLRDVPIAAGESMAATWSPLVCFGLYNYEHKVSVLHCSLKRANEYAAPIKAKEPMEFHVAFRRFVARPIYTLEGKGDKQPVQRFFQMGGFAMASFYGRITFPPASVIMFKPSAQVAAAVLGQQANAGGASASAAAASSGGVPSLSDVLVPAPLRSLSSIPFDGHVSPIVASGTLHSVNPDRMLIKRIVLTGTPISVHKRHAVVRHMFFNAEDVRYFKPVELWTKMGLVGHIKESRGTKGYMKAQFDKFIKQNDTVCMSLYKRQYPPWNPDLFASNL